jgi:hypothetical protein
MTQMTDREIFSGLEIIANNIRDNGNNIGYLDEFIEAGEFGLAYDEILSIIVNDKYKIDEKSIQFLENLKTQFASDYIGKFNHSVRFYLDF